jgi:hypothetical protein
MSQITLKSTFTITGDIHYEMHGIPYQELPMTKEGQDSAVLKLIDRKLKEQGVDAFEIAYVVKYDLDEEE